MNADERLSRVLNKLRNDKAALTAENAKLRDSAVALADEVADLLGENTRLQAVLARALSHEDQHGRAVMKGLKALNDTANLRSENAALMADFTRQVNVNGELRDTIDRLSAENLRLTGEVEHERWEHDYWRKLCLKNRE